MSTSASNRLLSSARGPGLRAVTETFFSWLEDSSGVPTLSGQISEETEVEERTHLGRFRLLGLLGEGGMGRVLLARDPDLQREVALKVLRERKKRKAELIDRFLGEARLTAQLQHPNIVPVHELGVTEDGTLFFVMKRVQGESLARVLRRMSKERGSSESARRRRRLIDGFRQICFAVAYAHQEGVLHRDIKPSNIMLGPFGEVLLMDWGLARFADGSREMPDDSSFEVDVERPVTRIGARLGTPGYMSPEQLRGGELDARSDVWSLGVVLHEIVSGRRALRGNALERLLESDEPVHAPLAPRGEPALSDELVEICQRAMSLDPDDRYPDARALADAVAEFLEGAKRTEHARLHYEEARGDWQKFQATERTLIKLKRTEELLRDLVPPWKPLSEKEALLAVRKQLREARHLRRDLFESVTTRCERALADDPQSEARALLARAHLLRSEESEEAGEEELAEHHRRRALSFDDGRLAAQLRRQGALRLHTDPPGAEVFCQRVDQSGVLWSLEPERRLGRTPIDDEPMAPGSYVLTLRAEGYADTTYPVAIRRGERWDARRNPVRLLRPAEIPAGFRYVPAGEFLCGGGSDGNPNEVARSMRHVPGFLLAEFPITCAQYAAFLTDLADVDPEEAWTRVPRGESGFKEVGGQYWKRPAPGSPYTAPTEDRDGDPWDPQWPAVAINWHDARAYARWASLNLGRDLRLVREWEWEKAARGVDGRQYPWGNTFDSSLCAVANSRPGRPVPSPIGAFPEDRSVYGVRDLAGGVKDWCGDDGFEGDPAQRPNRGGFWHGGWSGAQLHRRAGNLPNEVYTIFGFRLALDLPPPGR